MAIGMDKRPRCIETVNIANRHVAGEFGLRISIALTWETYWTCELKGPACDASAIGSDLFREVP